MYPADASHFRAVKFDKIVRATVAVPTTIFAVAYGDLTNPGQGRVKTWLYAERLG